MTAESQHSPEEKANGKGSHGAAFTVQAEVSTQAVPTDLHTALRMQPSYHSLLQHHNAISDPHGHKYPAQTQIF